MNLYPKLQKLNNNTKFSINLLNNIIGRIEYAADLIKLYKPSTVAIGNLYIGVAASTGAAIGIQTIRNFYINNKPAEISFVLGSALKISSSQYTNEYRLTPRLTDQVGAVWTRNIANAKAFQASFTYDVGDLYRADGYTIIFSANPFLGGTGGNIGYQGSLQVNAGPSVAVEIDTFQNGFDPSAFHIAILRDQNVINHLAFANIDSYRARIAGRETLNAVYANKILKVYRTGLVDGRDLTQLLLTYPIDIEQIINNG
jgi:hypothetical protein